MARNWLAFQFPLNAGGTNLWNTTWRWEGGKPAGWKQNEVPDSGLSSCVPRLVLSLVPR